MNLNQFFNVNNTNQNNTNISSGNINPSPPLYPSTPNFDFTSQNNQNEQDFADKKKGVNSGNFAPLLQLLGLFSSKKQDLSSLLTSSAVKSLGINENMLPLLNMLNNKKSKTLNKKEKSTLPKIDSLERIK